ncbi:MAG: hypothetical protein LBI39_00305 [Puniceicoccales bacterium]|nr:hypothetical protein [Puniceicoccales bacterium]
MPLVAAETHIGGDSLTAMESYYWSCADASVVDAANRAVVGPARSNGPFVSYFRLSGRMDSEAFRPAKGRHELSDYRCDYDAAGVVVGGAFEHKSPTGRLRVGIAAGEIERRYDWFYSGSSNLLGGAKDSIIGPILKGANDRAILCGIFSEMECIDEDRCRYGVAMSVSVANGKPNWATENQSIEFSSIRGSLEGSVLLRSSDLSFGPFVRGSYDSGDLSFHAIEKNIPKETPDSSVNEMEYTSHGIELQAGFKGEKHITKHASVRFQISAYVPLRHSASVDFYDTSSPHGKDTPTSSFKTEEKQRNGVSGSLGFHGRVGSIWEVAIEGGAIARSGTDFSVRGNASVACEF